MDWGSSLPQSKGMISLECLSLGIWAWLSTMRPIEEKCQLYSRLTSWYQEPYSIWHIPPSIKRYSLGWPWEIHGMLSGWLFLIALLRLLKSTARPMLHTSIQRSNYSLAGLPSPMNSILRMLHWFYLQQAKAHNTNSKFQFRMLETQ